MDSDVEKVAHEIERMVRTANALRAADIDNRWLRGSARYWQTRAEASEATIARLREALEAAEASARYREAVDSLNHVTDREIASATSDQ